LNIGMPQQHLYGSQIRPGFQHVRGIAMS
jgi:hypothetical protein